MRQYERVEGHGRLQLSDLDATAIFGEMIAILPGGIQKLRALHNNFAEMDAGAGVYLLGENVDAGTQAKDETCVFPVEDNVAAG